MAEQQETYYSLGDISKSIRSFLRYLRGKWWLLLAAAVVGGVLGFLYYRSQKPKYDAVCTFILEEKSGGGGSLAGLASQFGFDLGGGGGGGSIFSGDNILNILPSRKVVQKVLLSPGEDSAVAGQQTLADRFAEFSGLRQQWERKKLDVPASFGSSAGNLSPKQDSLLNVIYEAVVRNHLTTERVSKQGTIIRVQVTAPDRQFARLLTERLVTEASKLYLNIRVGTAQENIRLMQRRSDSLLALLNNRSYRAAASQPLDVNPGLTTAIVPVEIATRDKAVLGTLYAEVTKNLEASKLLLSQQTPVIQLLDSPAYLLKDNKKGLMFLVVFAAAAGVFLSLLAVAMLYLVHIMGRKADATAPKL